MNPNIASVQTNAEGEKQVKLVLAFILSLSKSKLKSFILYNIVVT